MEPILILYLVCLVVAFVTVWFFLTGKVSERTMYVLCAVAILTAIIYVIVDVI